MRTRIKSKHSTRVCIHDSIRKIAKCKRSQEEMVGFVLIIVLVSVIALVFLGMSIRTKTATQNSIEIEDFLQALSRYTTECAINYEPEYSTINDLYKSCLEKENCINEKSSCAVLNETLVKIIGDSWPTGESYKTKAYFLKIEYSNESFYELRKGNCTGSRTLGEYFTPYSGDNIITSLEICNQENLEFTTP